MKFQPNWEKIKERMTAFWDGAVIDRAMFYIEAPRDGVKKKEIIAPPTPEERAMNIDYQIESQMAHIEATYYGADALPSLSFTLGPSTSSILLGAKARFTQETTWTAPCIDEWIDLNKQMRIHWEDKFWRTMETGTRRSAQAAENKCLVQLPSLLHGLDGLADLRGTEKLSMDLVDQPAVIHAALLHLNGLWRAIYEALWKIVSSAGAECTRMIPLWCRGRSDILQCDFMVNISKDMFVEFMVDDLKKCAAFLDRSIFHLDGQEAVHHLEALLSLEDLDGIQFQQGSIGGQHGTLRSMMPFIPMLKKIQAAGKFVYISVPPKEIEPVMRELSSRRLFLSTAVETETEARRLENLVAKLTHD